MNRFTSASKSFGRNGAIDQSHRRGLRRRERRAFEDHPQRLPQADESRQPLRAAPAGDQSELHLGEAEFGLRIVAGDAVAAGERELQPAAQARPVDDRDGRARRAARRGRTARCPAARTARTSSSVSSRRISVDVRPGQEPGRLRAAEHDRPRRVALELLHDLLEFPERPRR